MQSRSSSCPKDLNATTLVKEDAMASAKRNRQRQMRLLHESSVGAPTRIVGDLVALDEAAIRPDGTAPIKIISPGWGTSGYYSAAVLEAAAGDGVFPAGTQMFWDHPTITERGDRPERSLRDLAAVTETGAVWRDVHPAGPGLYAEAKVFSQYRDVLAEMAEHIGVSIRAGAEISAGEAEGRKGRIVQRLVEGLSIDFVTKPGRGGQVLAVLEAAREAGMWNDDLRQKFRTALRERFPQDDGHYLWVRDFDDDNVVFKLEGDPGPGCYLLGYTIDGDDVTLADGEPTKVDVRTTYEPVDEARNIAEWMQSRIHVDFTTRADDMFGQGHLTKEERIALSNGIGAALDAFSQTVEDLAPQLLTRDLWADPAATTPESKEDQTMPITQEERAAIAAEAATAVITQLTETGVITAPPAPGSEVDESAAKLTAAEERAQRAEEALLVEAAGRHVAANEKVKGLPQVTQTRLVESLSKAVEATDDGKLDTTKLDEAIKAAVDDEVKYLDEATGSPVRGVGDAAAAVDEAAVEGLEKAFSRLGLDDKAAKVATAGRA